MRVACLKDFMYDYTEVVVDKDELNEMDLNCYYELLEKELNEVREMIDFKGAVGYD